MAAAADRLRTKGGRSSDRIVRGGAGERSDLSSLRAHDVATVERLSGGASRAAEGRPRRRLRGGRSNGDHRDRAARCPSAVHPDVLLRAVQTEKQNADDPSSCPRWREAIEGKLQSVAGDYVYRVRWPDGTIRRGTLRFDMGDEGKTITLRKP